MFAIVITFIYINSLKYNPYIYIQYSTGNCTISKKFQITYVAQYTVFMTFTKILQFSIHVFVPLLAHNISRYII